jgi:hypothetical protein
MFDQLITDLAESGIDINALNEEFTKALNFERMQVMARDHMMSEVRHDRHRGVDGLGYCSLEIPSEAYFDWAARHPGCWQDSGERRRIIAKNPHWKRKYQPKPQTGWTPTQDRTAGGLYLGSKYGAAA